jgi:hypothetical protein
VGGTGFSEQGGKGRFLQGYSKGFFDCGSGFPAAICLTGLKTIRGWPRLRASGCKQKPLPPIILRLKLLGLTPLRLLGFDGSATVLITDRLTDGFHPEKGPFPDKN